MEEDREPLAFRQRKEQLLHLVRRLAFLGGNQAREWTYRVVGTQAIASNVEHDAPEPRLKISLRAETPAAVQCDRKRVLYDVECCIRITEHRGRAQRESTKALAIESLDLGFTGSFWTSSRSTTIVQAAIP